jgi:hypothetical protein
MTKERRFQIHYGLNDGAGYVVTDSTGTGDWRGRITFKTDSRSDAEERADELNLKSNDVVH